MGQFAGAGVVLREIDYPASSIEHQGGAPGEF
jgi:hypothetical protein